MSDEQPTPKGRGSDEDLIFTIAHALRHRGGKATQDADRLIAKVAAERILEALTRSYIITPKPSAPLTRADQHSKMGGNR